MARYGDNAIDEVRQRADIVEIIGAHVRLRRTGRNFVGLCPFHNEKTPSFSVNRGARILSIASDAARAARFSTSS